MVTNTACESCDSHEAVIEGMCLVCHSGMCLAGACMSAIDDGDMDAAVDAAIDALVSKAGYDMATREWMIDHAHMPLATMASEWLTGTDEYRAEMDAAMIQDAMDPRANLYRNL